ncbi:MAG: CopD family protein [Candidatus Binatia bacterium]
MQGFYLVSVWLHIMAAVVWVGGTIFLVIVLVPAIRRAQFAGVASALIRFTALRFCWLGWVCFCVFVLTGIMNLAARGIGWQELQEPVFWQGPFGRTLAIKLILVAAILAISGFHDFFLGPRAAAAWESDAASAETLRLRRQAVQLGRLNLMLALTTTILGVMLVRGPPW